MQIRNGLSQSAAMSTISPPNIGEPAPWFSAPTGTGPSENVVFDELAGRYIALFFFGSASRPDVAEVLSAFEQRSDVFDHTHALLVGLSRDPEDFDRGRLHHGHVGQLFLWDRDAIAATRYGAAPSAPGHPVAFIMSPALQIIAIVQLTDPAAFAERIAAFLTETMVSLPAPQNAPVLVLPQVFDRSFCQRLIVLYEASGGREIGLIENQGQIIQRIDTKFRKRLDYYVSDEQALQDIKVFLQRRLLPVVFRAFQFETTRIERYLVGCYDASTGGYFRPHRDNTAPAVAHRRFALTINLNDGYEGGELCFPEFGHQSFRTSPGDAIVFSCSLLHEVKPVTHGRRYAFISFLYDEQSQKLRDAYATKAG